LSDWILLSRQGMPRGCLFKVSFTGSYHFGVLDPIVYKNLPLISQLVRDESHPCFFDGICEVTALQYWILQLLVTAVLFSLWWTTVNAVRSIML